MWENVQHGLKSGFDIPLPKTVFSQVLDRAFLAYGNRVWAGSSLILLLGLLWRLVQEKWAFTSGEKDYPNYLSPVVVLVGYVALLTSYQPIVRGGIEIIGNLAQGFVSTDNVAQALHVRSQAMAAALPQNGSNHTVFSMNTVYESIFYFFGFFLYGFVAWAVWSLKCMQTFVLAVIVIYGPIALSFSYIGGMFTGLGLAWFWSLVEVSAWGVTFDILNFILAPVIQTKPAEFLLVNEIGLCLVLLVLVRSVPQVTQMLIRGASSSVQQVPSPGAYTASMVRVAEFFGRFKGRK